MIEEIPDQTVTIERAEPSLTPQQLKEHVDPSIFGTVHNQITVSDYVALLGRIAEGLLAGKEISLENRKDRQGFGEMVGELADEVIDEGLFAFTYQDRNEPTWLRFHGRVGGRTYEVMVLGNFFSQLPWEWIDGWSENENRSGDVEVELKPEGFARLQAFATAGCMKVIEQKGDGSPIKVGFDVEKTFGFLRQLFPPDLP